jgi:hypothetical protein
MQATMREGMYLQNNRLDLQALDTLERAFAMAKALGDEGRAAAEELVWRVAYTRAHFGRVDEALASAREFMLGAEGHALESLWRREFANLLVFAARHEEAILQADRAVALARAAGERRRLSECLITRSVIHSETGHLQAGWRDCDQARQLLRAVDGTERPTIHDRQLAGYLREAGRFAEALALIQPALEWFSANRNVWWIQSCQFELARLYVALGQPGRAQQILAGIEPASASMRLSLLMYRARIARAMGQPARALAEEAAALAPQTERPVVLACAVMIELAPELEPQAAAERIEQALAEARRHGLRGFARALRLRRIESLVRARRAAEAAPDAAALLDELRKQGAYWIYAPEYWWALHRAFAAAGDAPAAREALASGRRWILETALPHVPAEFRDSFLHRNLINRELLAAAQRELG